MANLPGVIPDALKTVKKLLPRPVSGLASIATGIPPSRAAIETAQWPAGTPELAYRCGGSTGIAAPDAPGRAPVSRFNSGDERRRSHLSANAMITLEALEPGYVSLHDNPIEALANLDMGELRHSDRHPVRRPAGAKFERVRGDQLREQALELGARQRVPGVVRELAGASALGAACDAQAGLRREIVPLAHR